MQDDVGMDQAHSMFRDHRVVAEIHRAEAAAYQRGLADGTNRRQDPLLPRWVRYGGDCMPLPAGTVMVYLAPNLEYPLEAKVYWRMGWDYWAHAGSSGDRRDDELHFPCKIVHVPQPGRPDMVENVLEHLRSLPTTQPTPEEVRAYENGEGE